MSVLSQVQGLPGARAAKTAVHRMVTRGGWIPDILPAGKHISGACSRDPGNTGDTARLRAGMLMGKIATVVNSLGAVGDYAPSIIDVTANAQAPGDTSITLSAAGAAEVLRRCGSTGTFLIYGPGAANGVIVHETVTYSAINVTTGVLTVTAIVSNYVAGSFVMPTDGSADMITFLPSGFPTPVTDFDGTSIVQEFPEVPIDCVIDSAQLLPVWPTDTSLQEYIVSRLSRPAGGKFTFSHLY